MDHNDSPAARFYERVFDFAESNLTEMFNKACLNYAKKGPGVWYCPKTIEQCVINKIDDFAFKYIEKSTVEELNYLPGIDMVNVYDYKNSFVILFALNVSRKTEKCIYVSRIFKCMKSNNSNCEDYDDNDITFISSNISKSDFMIEEDLLLSEKGQSCRWCGDENVVLKYCGDCKQVEYCSTDCQKKHYRTHKNQCRSIRKLRNVIKGKNRRKNKIKNHIILQEEMKECN